MADLELRELECVLALGEELHFGRTAERLGVSQGRVSQLVRTVERRIGGRLFERTSRRVRLTELGHHFLQDVRPSYSGLHRAVRSARRAARSGGVVRLGFSGLFDENIAATVTAAETRNPGLEVVLHESPLNDPFGPVRRGTVDAAITFGAVEEPDLVVGAWFSAHPQAIVVSARHPLAGRSSISAEELASTPLIEYADPAPAYWRESVAPSRTPAGREIPRAEPVSTLQEGVIMAAANRGAMLFCLPTALRLRRDDVVVVPVDDLPASARSLVWRQGADTELLHSLADSLTWADHQRTTPDAATASFGTG